MNNSALIQTFYSALQKLDYKTMQQCYHPEATFHDPAFGLLNAEEAKAMWEMLCRNAKNFALTYENIVADDAKGSCEITATYTFSKTQRHVVNRIDARFKFKDGKFIEHRDAFNLWRWSRQALGLPGLLLGWLPAFQSKIRRNARSRLKSFIDSRTAPYR